MEAKNDIIVALEFGTSSIRGIAGRKRADGNVQVLGIEFEEARDKKDPIIQKGIIDNIDKTAQAIHNIVGRLSDKLKVQITRAYVGLGGQSLHTELNVIKRDMETSVKITPEVTDNMKDNNRQVAYPNAEILDVVPQEFLVGNKLVADPVGVMADNLEARFLNIVARTTIREQIERAMRLANVQVADYIISPMALADALLSTAEKRSGCALVDFGAGTTTISYYKENILRKLIVLPLGGNSITGDLMNINQLDFDEADRLKRKEGVALLEAEPEESTRMVPLPNDRAIAESTLLAIIADRQEEIIQNVWDQLKANEKNLLSGIVITGAAAQLKNMGKAIEAITGMNRIQIAPNLIAGTDCAPDVISPLDKSTNTLIALLMQGDQNCVTEISEEGEKPEEVPVAEAEEEKPAEENPEKNEDEGKKKKKKSKNGGFMSRFRTGFKRAIDLLQEEEEDRD